MIKGLILLLALLLMGCYGEISTPDTETVKIHSYVPPVLPGGRTYSSVTGKTDYFIYIDGKAEGVVIKGNVFRGGDE